MKETPPTFWDGVMTGVAVVCGMIAIVLAILGALGVIGG
jgi:hypothetical protein